MSEANVQQAVRLEAARKGVYLWRNNCGAGRLENGNFVRWGLANESEAVNRVLKSGDLIGVRSVLITPEMVGQRIGVFVSRECKREDWKPDNSERYLAQKRWADLIASLGGDAQIVTGAGSL